MVDERGLAVSFRTQTRGDGALSFRGVHVEAFVVLPASLQFTSVSFLFSVGDDGPGSQS